MLTFVQLVVRIRELFQSKLVDLDEVKRLLASYKSNANEWRRFAIFDMKKYTRNLVDVGNGSYNLMILCWGPGMASSIHDHTDAHCFVKILDGELTETTYCWPKKLRVPLDVLDNKKYQANGVSYMNDEIGLHRMENQSHSNGVVSLHLYVPPYSTCNSFDERSGKRTKCTVTFYSKYGRKVNYRGSRNEEIPQKMTRFSGKTVIITGSSNGIGRATALLFARYGAQVTITGRDAERLEETKKQILKVTCLPENLNVVVANLTDSDGQDQIIQSTLDKFGKIDILVNNAGANISDGTKNTDQSIELYHKTFQINFQAVVEMIQKTKEHLIKTKGEIVNVSSIAGEAHALSATPYYSASKAALNQYTRCVALDLIQYGIRVNSVSPGVISTGFLGAMGLPKTDQEKVANFMASKKGCIPAGVCGKPNDIAEIIVFLSDRKRSSYIVGQSIVADGGTSLTTGMEAYDIQDMI